ncbi:uncharacterized protein LOC101220350 isoform X2 [Cucumis sativus]|uniref:uncharacterized protein LOC101220350 isoform X2 n=1 Tax=Cucumis sativus TaxID=3659 RepID=UPI0012F4AF7C|nr:uncharacterized protein LOC101220350 isoform X2 [Cucumis sativus]
MYLLERKRGKALPKQRGRAPNSNCRLWPIISAKFLIWETPPPRPPSARFSAMATRLPTTKPFSFLTSRLFPDENSLAAALIGSSRRWASSTTASPPGKSQKTEKKLVDRLSSVIDAVNDRKLPPELRGQRNSVRSETDLINVVERRIWNSMEEGQFENLPGKGKPLNLSINPHADPAEDTLYRILSKNGCAPEWVELNKEIRSNISEWRSSLKKAFESRGNGDHSIWTESKEGLQVQLQHINDKFTLAGFSV